jgi:hypothetical protein
VFSRSTRLLLSVAAFAVGCVGIVMWTMTGHYMMVILHVACMVPAVHNIQDVMEILDTEDEQETN